MSLSGFYEGSIGSGNTIQYGRGRALDNGFVERLWRALKYKEIYLYGYLTVIDVNKAIQLYFLYYNTERLHQSLNYQTVYKVHFDHKCGLAKAC
ncbi:MAG: transposase [Chlamydiia bacterium]